MLSVMNSMHYGEQGFGGGACKCSHAGVRGASLWECVSRLADGRIWVLAMAV